MRTDFNVPLFTAGNHADILDIGYYRRGDMPNVQHQIEIEQEDDGRWIAEILNLPGVMAYGMTREEAIAHAEALALRVIADRIDESKSGVAGVTFGGA